ncbi:esterase/lipase family protein [Micromonospora haikouensis]|uniref:esterase/lipase family protein n=1 Tax=Micromonospora haikouensis TaxID=686309 RepID=UPI003D73730A
MLTLDRRLVALLVLTAVFPAAEATVLVAMDFVAAEGIAPQVSAVWPYDTYHDLRWLFVYHRSWPEFVLWLAYVALTRGALTTGLVALSWPVEAPRPPVRQLLKRNIGVSVMVTVLVVPWAVISVAASVVALSWVLLASLLPMFLLAPFLQRAAAVGPWWRGLPSLPLVGWTLLNFVVLTLAGAVAWSVPGWWTVPVAAAAGVVNGVLWNRTVRAAVLAPRLRWARVPVAPIVALLALVVPLLIPALVSTVPGNQLRTEDVLLTRPLPPEVTEAVVVLAGYGSAYGGEQPRDPRVERFSYRGLGPDGKPLPYRPQDTTISVADSVGLLADQVDRLHRRTGRKVALVGESEGAIVARTYLARRPHPAVDALVMFSPLINAGRAYYPPRGQDDGWGVVTGWMLRAMFGLGRLAGAPGNGPDEPFIRSLLDDAPFLRNQLMCPVPGVRMVAFLPYTTAAEAPPGDYTGIPVFQTPGVHGGLLNRSLVQDRLVNFLGGEPVQRTRREYPLLQRLGAAWQAPPLAISANPAWEESEQPDPALTGKVCQPSREPR